jgi:hypothetical protein
MSHYRNHPDFYNKPVLLTADEIKDPYKFIQEFFAIYPLSIVRDTNRDIDQTCMATEMAPFDDSDGRYSLMQYRWYETKLLEAAFVLLRNQSAVAPATVHLNSVQPGPQKSDTPPSNSPTLATVVNESTNDLIHFGDVRRRLLDIQAKVTELRDKILLVWGEQALAFLESQKKPK